MNRQRKVIITITYNDLGIIVDTKAEELNLSSQPTLQPTCNNLATDTISRQAAIDVAKAHWYKPDIVGAIEQLPSAQSETIRCKECEHWDKSWANNDWGTNCHYCPIIDRVCDEN